MGQEPKGESLKLYLTIVVCIIKFLFLKLCIKKGFLEKDYVNRENYILL